MKKLLRYALLCAVAMFSTAAMADNTTTVGAEDCSAGWWSAFSDYYTIAPNKTLTLKFKNYNYETQNWHNWLVAVTTDADRDAEGYSEYVVLRADNYAWQYGLNTGPDSSHDWYTSLSSNYAWDTFMSDMKGSDVKMTIKRLNEVVTIHADITTAGGKTYFEEFVINCGDGTQTIRAFLTVEKSFIVIDNTATTITDTEVPEPVEEGETTTVGNEDNTTAWWTAFSKYYTVPGGQTLHVEFTNYTDMAENWHNWLCVAANAERGAEGYYEYFALRADNYAWGDGKNTDAKSADYWGADNFVLTSNYNWDNFKSDMQGAKVALDITNNTVLNKIVCDATITTVGDNTYTMRFIKKQANFDVAVADPITVFFTTESGHLVIDNTATTLTDMNFPNVTAEGTLIGDPDCTSPFCSAFTDACTLEKNKMATFKFKNYSDRRFNWDNWNLVVTNNVDRAAPAMNAPRRADDEAYKEYFVLRADNWCFGESINFLEQNYTLTCDYDWDTFIDEMDGSTVELKVMRDGAKITAHADVTAADGTTKRYEELVVDNCGDGEQPIRAFLTVCNSCIDLQSAEVADNPSATGIETVKAAANTSVVRYNLAGQQVSEDYHGVVIENGRKLIAK